MTAIKEKERGMTDVFGDENPSMNGEIKTSRTERKKIRIPISTRNILKAPVRKGFHRRFFNDVDDRIARAEDAGYNFVKGDVPTGDKSVGDGSKKGSCVTKSVGGGRVAYLMEIPQEYYDEDQKAKQDEIDETERGMITNIGTKEAGTDGRYGKIAIG